MRTIAAVLLAGLATFPTLGCGRTEDGRSPGAAPDVARITCGAEAGTRVLTPVVEPQQDGLHLAVTNEASREAHVTLEHGSSGGAGAAAPPGTSEVVLGIGPGSWTVTCYEAGPVSSGTFELLDTGTWVSTEVDGCEITESTHGDPPRKVTGDAEELPRLAGSSLEAFVGLEPGYAIESAGYPEQDARIFRARRDGRTIATISFYRDGEGAWLEGEATACGDLDGGGSSEPGA